MLYPRQSLLLILSAVGAVTACGHRSAATSATGGCDDSIKLPPGFCATIFSESAGPARHLVVRHNGDVLVGVLDQHRQAGGILALRDTNHDGHADLEERFGDSGVHGVALVGDTLLYASTATAILRYHLSSDSLAPRKRVDTIVTGLAQRPIPSHSLAIDMRGNIIVNIGAASDGCQVKEVPGAPGRDPCPELAYSGGIWSFRPDHVNQQLKDGKLIATGLHNAIALTVSPFDTMVYAVSHDRDGLHDLWPQLYSDEESATLPAEEMIRVASTHANFGWPYCYYDYLKQTRVMGPEYGGDKENPGRCDRLIQPLVAFPAHWSPMSILFYTGKMFPPNYRGGAFIAFHGSAYRSPLPEEGYQVVFLTFKQGLAADYTNFATGFAGGEMNPQSAAHRPVGLAQGPDGALFISDDKAGRIWRVTYSNK